MLSTVSHISIPLSSLLPPETGGVRLTGEVRVSRTPDGRYRVLSGWADVRARQIAAELLGQDLLIRCEVEVE